jgi:hypothetical protein
MNESMTRILVSICSLRFFRHFPSDDRRRVLCAARDTYCWEQSSVMMSPRCLARFRFEGCVTHIKDVWLLWLGDRFIWLPDADPLGLDIIV